jgi:hypothetical protein
LPQVDIAEAVAEASWDQRILSERVQRFDQSARKPRWQIWRCCNAPIHKVIYIVMPR